MKWYENAVFYHIYPLGLCGCAHQNTGAEVSKFEKLKNILEEHLPEVWISELQGTYLMWIDLGKYIKPEDMERVIQDECGIAVDYGSWFGGTNGGDEYAGFIRVNLATRPENVEILD